MRIGFTGTRRGMSLYQKRQLLALLEPTDELHHGDCVGADAEAHEIAHLVGCRVVVHPPTDPRWRMSGSPASRRQRAFCRLEGGDELLEPKAHLARNRDIVNATEFLVAAPRTDREELRSGTWATIRYARKIRRNVTMLQREAHGSYGGQ